MDRSDSILKKLDNITYLMELVRSEIDHATYESLLEYGDDKKGILEIKDITEENGSVLEGFNARVDNEKGVVIEFRDGREIPFYDFETDNMYDIFVRIQSELLDDTGEDDIDE